jgi:hypothetical protein
MIEGQPKQPVVGEEKPFAERVAEMSLHELRRRVLTQRDYIARFQACVDGFGLRHGLDGHRLPGDIRAAVAGLGRAAAADSEQAPLDTEDRVRLQRAGSPASVPFNERVQIRSGWAGGGVVRVRMQTGKNTHTTQLLDIEEAARLASALAQAIETAMPENDEVSDSAPLSGAFDPKPLTKNL